MSDERCSAPNRSDWFKSSYSNASASCLEALLGRSTTIVRDSKDRSKTSPVIKSSTEAWNCLLKEITVGNSRR